MVLFTPLNLVLFGLWAISAIFDYLEFCYLWQLKEYRLDRMRDFFSTKQGRKYWLSPAFLVRSLFVIILVFWPINTISILKFIILGVLLAEIIVHGLSVYQKKLRYPKPTPKALLILGASFIFEASIAWWQRDWTLVFVLMVVRFFIMSGIVFLSNQITQRIKDLIIYQATRKIARLPELLTIGITGSYGKSSVKEYTSQLLGVNFTVVNTPGNINTDIGVAQFILRTDFTKAQIFVCEMGAYRIGEISRICKIVKPKIGILTSIIEQHLSLFGSLKNIQTAKYELLRSIPETGLVITNADNAYCTELLSELTCQNQKLFGDESDNQPDYLITETKAKAGVVSWQVQTDEPTPLLFTAAVLGAHQPYNITPAIIVAKHLGISFTEIARAVTTLKPGANALSWYQYQAADIIDDTYNSNPKGFKAALDILSSFPSTKRRIVITRGMLELADKSAEYHAKIGEEIAFCADELVIISPDSADDFMTGVQTLKNKYHLEVRFIFDPVELVQYVKNKTTEQTVVLLENRMPSVLMSEVKK